MTDEIGGILLAAGESSRMGRPKPLLPWGGRTLVEFCIGEMVAAKLSPLLCVVGHAADRVAPLARAAGAATLENHRYAEGRATSIAAAIGALDDEVIAAVICSVDQPRDRRTIEALVGAFLSSRAPIVRAVHRGQHGHPTLFARSLFPDLLGVAEASEGMKSVLRQHAADILDLEVDDPLVVVNLNTPEEYESARRLFER